MLHFPLFSLHASPGMASFFQRFWPSSRQPASTYVSSTPVEKMLEALVHDRLPQLRSLLQEGTLDRNFLFGRSARSLLHVAASFNAINCLLYLASLGLDVNGQDLGGTTPAHLAARNGHKTCLKALVETLKADLSVPDACGFTVMHWLASTGRVNLLLYLLNLGQKIDVRDASGQSLLHIACHTGHTAVVSALLARGACTEWVDSQGKTPLHYVCKHGQPSCAAILLAAGAQIAEDNDGKIPITLALENHHPECVATLVTHRPELLPALWTAMYSLVFEEREALEALWHICLQSSSTSVQRLFAALVEQTLLSGQELLCHSSAPRPSDDGLVFLRFARCCRTLLKNIQQHPELGQDDALLRMLGRQVQTLEPLWDTLHQWLKLAATADVGDDILGLRRSQICAAVHGAWLLSSAFGTAAAANFHTMVTNHMAVLRAFVRCEPTLIFDHFSFILHNTAFLNLFAADIHQQPLAERREWLYKNLISPAEVLQMPQTPNLIEQPAAEHRNLDESFVVDRDSIVASSCQLFNGDMARWKSKFTVKFKNEDAYGDGVKREWLTLLSRELLNENYGLFVRRADGTYEPSPQSSANPDHLQFFQFAGRAVGLALYHRELLGVRFSRSFCKHLVGQPLADGDGLTDLEATDPAFARSLQWLLDTELTPELTEGLTFVAPQDELGWWPVTPLVPGGENLAVTEANKREYVGLLCQFKLRRVIETQLQAFLSGLHDFVPASLLALFSPEELQCLLSGATEIDVDDWFLHTELAGSLTPDHQVVQWFWQIVRQYSHEQRQQLLQFATASPTVPIGGFSSLCGAEGPRKFTLVLLETSGQLPTAATCFNLLRVPDVASKEALEQALSVAISSGREGFSFS